MRVSDETRAAALAIALAIWMAICLLSIGGALGVTLWLSVTIIGVMYAVHDERMEQEQERRRRYEQDCARRAREEAELCGR